MNDDSEASLEPLTKECINDLFQLRDKADFEADAAVLRTQSHSMSRDRDITRKLHGMLKKDLLRPNSFHNVKEVLLTCEAIDRSELTIETKACRLSLLKKLIDAAIIFSQRSKSSFLERHVGSDIRGIVNILVDHQSRLSAKKLENIKSSNGCIDESEMPPEWERLKQDCGNFFLVKVSQILDAFALAPNVQSFLQERTENKQEIRLLLSAFYTYKLYFDKFDAPLIELFKIILVDYDNDDD